MNNLEIIESLPEDIRRVVRKHQGQWAPYLVSLHPEGIYLESIYLLIQFVLEQACIIHDLKSESSAYAQGVEDGAKKTNEIHRASLAYERKKVERLQARLDYILDTLSEPAPEDDELSVDVDDYPMF